MPNFKEIAIKKTIKYATRFNGGLTLKQLGDRLISNKLIFLDSADERGLMSREEYKQKYWPVIEKKVEIAKRFSKVISKLPWITFIGISGGVAAGYPKEKDDVDIVIICSKDSLWISRIMVYVFAFLKSFKIRKGKSHKVKDRLCLNLWMEMDSLKIPKSKQRLSVAMDTIMVKSIYDKGGVWFRFLNENRWIAKFVANGYKKGLAKNGKNVKDIYEFNMIISILNRLAYYLQKTYMARKMRSELVSLRYAFFHPKG